MKKQSITILLILLISMISTKAFADANGKCGDNLTWTYVEDTKTLTISGSGDMWNYYFYDNTAPWYNFKDKILNVTIYEGVSSIGDYAFYYCSDLTSITIPNGVTSIGAGAFNTCSGLTSVTIPNSVTSIGDRAFAGCGLTSITIPNCVTTISDYAFFYCSGLTSVTIPNSVASIGQGAFENCSGLTSITIPNSVASIGQGAFENCSGLTSVKISDVASWCNIKFVASKSNPLYYAHHLYLNGEEIKDLVIPNTMTSIGEYIFSGCSGLTSVTIPNSVTSIGKYIFSGCSGLTSVTIPNSVTSIGAGAFERCSGLTSIIIPNSVSSIGFEVFSGCSGLTSVTLPNSVTSIGQNAFYCSGLTSVTIPNSVTSIGRAAFGGCSGLTSITIPNGVTSIAGGAFNGCHNLITVIIPNSVTSIGGSVFQGCYNLIKVMVEMKTPVEIGIYTFDNRKNATLYVPSGCKAAYATAKYWKEFREIVEMVESPDISQMNNAIYVEPLSARAGDDVSIKVCLKNSNAATSYGFELVLPQGLSIATTSEGDFDDAVTMSGRHKGHTLTTNKLADDTYKVGVASLSSKALTDNDGLVLTIKAHVADNMALGDYPIIIQNPLIVNTDGTKPTVQITLSKITVADYTKGDVDGDGVVDLADAVLVINHYVGKPVNKFVTGAADVDGDGVIDLADAVRIINFYVGKVQSLAPSIGLDGLDPQ